MCKVKNMVEQIESAKYNNNIIDLDILATNLNKLSRRDLHKTIGELGIKRTMDKDDIIQNILDYVKVGLTCRKM